jgi:hypothetical protein
MEHLQVLRVQSSKELPLQCRSGDPVVRAEGSFRVQWWWLKVRVLKTEKALAETVQILPGGFLVVHPGPLQY